MIYPTIPSLLLQTLTIMGRLLLVADGAVPGSVSTQRDSGARDGSHPQLA